jgi:protein involved in polysaccharide export with SLBB domain
VAAQDRAPQPFSTDRLQQFGYQFFRPAAVGFAPNTDVPIPPEYVLGPCDRIVPTLWGSLEGTYGLEINRSGDVVLPKVGTVRRLPNWVEETERYVTLSGEVRFPGVYPIFKGEHLASVLKRAGGFTDRAYLRGAKFTRRSVQEELQRRLDEVLLRTETDIAQKQTDVAVVASSQEELQATQAALDGLRRSLNFLKVAQSGGPAGDSIEPPARVRGGAVRHRTPGGRYPRHSPGVQCDPHPRSGLQPHHGGCPPSKPVSYYLAQAGGPNRDADESAIYVIRANGSVVSRQQSYTADGSDNWFGGRWGRGDFMDLELASGDTVAVPQELEKIAWMREIKDMTQMLGNIALSAGVLIAAGL